MADVQAKDIIAELKAIAFADLQHYVDVDPDTGAIRCKGFDEMPPNASRALKAIQEDRVIKENADGTSVTVYDKVKFKCHSKIEALKLLGTYRDLWRDKSVEKDPDFDLSKFKKLTEADKKNLSLIAQKVVTIYIKELHATDSR